MFDSLSDRLGRIVRELRGQARLTEENVAAVLREVRLALLEADVALPVVKQFLEQLQQRAVGREIHASLTPGQAIIKIVGEEMTRLMGSEATTLRLDVPAPAVVLLAGLQGAGKTTTAAKLARHLQSQGKKVLLSSCDVYRPAAIDQLETLARENSLPFFRGESRQAAEIAAAALKSARTGFHDVLILDTAGRLHVDADMMAEIRTLHQRISPTDTLFIVDAMLGQDAVATARAFSEALPLTGVILTKVDGDARGGAALSVRQVTGAPILYMGTGEKIDAFSAFHPDRIASRILGMGDVLTLIEEVEQKADRKQAQKLARKINKGRGFDLDDFRDQVRQMQAMGGLSSLMDKLPGMGQLPAAAASQVNDGELVRLEAMINSMTPRERRHPAVINGSRKKRIAAGSGTQVQDINRLLKQFNQMQKMMKKLSKKGGMQRLMRGLGGNLPPGFRP